MDELYADKVLPTANIQPTIHTRFPTEKISLVDHSIEKIEPCVIFPESTDLNQKSSIEFVIHESSQYYIDLSSLQLEVTLSLHLANGNVVPEAANVYFTNNLLSSLFPIRKSFINNVCVETQYSGHHIGRIKQLLYAKNDLTANRGQSRGLFVLDPTRLSSPLITATCDNNADRQTFAKKDLVHLKGYLEMDICGINMWLLDLLTYRLVLEAAPDNLVINSKDNATAYKIKIHSLKLHCNRIKPTHAGFLTATFFFQKSPFEYMFTRHIVHSELLAAGQSSLTINRPFTSRIPHLLYIFMVKQSGDTGAYNEDPGYYQTNGLTNYRIMIDGKLLIDQDLSPDNDAVSAYVNSLTAHNNSEYFVPFNMYTKGCFLLVVKTNHSQESEISFTRKGNLSIHLKFEGNIAENQIVYVIGKCHSAFEVTADRNIITNYSY